MGLSGLTSSHASPNEALLFIAVLVALSAMLCDLVVLNETLLWLKYSIASFIASGLRWAAIS